MRNFRIACVSSFNELGQQEVNVREVRRDVVEYVTEKRKTLVIDFSNHRLDNRLDAAYQPAMYNAGLPPDFKAGQSLTVVQGQLAVQMLCIYVAENPAPTKAMKERWDELWQADRCELEYMLNYKGGAAMCRERAILMHILMADFGIPTRVVRASDAQHNGHSWVVYDDPKTGRPELGFDPAHRAIYRGPADEDPMLGAVFSRHVQWFRIVEPIVRNAALLDQNPGWVCLPDMPQ